MENALALADKCWAKANAVAPEFVEEYLACAEELLQHKPVVLGDEFREFCSNRKVHRPATLHPNVWVSGVGTLKKLGWIRSMGKVEPTKAHNHMPSVTQWQSLLYLTIDDLV